MTPRDGLASLTRYLALMTGQNITKLPVGKKEVRGGHRLALIPKMTDCGFVVWAFQTSVRGLKKSFQHSFDRASREGLVGDLISEKSWDPRLITA